MRVRRVLAASRDSYEYHRTDRHSRRSSLPEAWLQPTALIQPSSKDGTCTDANVDNQVDYIASFICVNTDKIIEKHSVTSFHLNNTNWTCTKLNTQII